MTTWRITDNDRDAAGRIRTVFADTLADTMTAVGADEPQAATGRRIGRLELAGGALGLVIALALMAALSRFAPAPAPRIAPTAQPAPTARPTVRPPTLAPAAAPATAVPVPTPAPPTPEPVVIVQPPPCDPANPPYQAREQVGDIGSVVGLSCDSLAAAQANADALAAQLRADAWHPPMTAAACVGWHPPMALPEGCE